MDDLAAAVARLTAVHEIQQLAYRYATTFDARDVPALERLWHQDVGEVSFPDMNFHTVRTQFGRWLSGLGPTILSVTNHVIDLEGDDRATGTVYCSAQIDLGEQFIEHAVVYEDRYVRHDGRWLFEVRRHLLFYGRDLGANPFRQAPANWPDGMVGNGTLPEGWPSYRALRAA